MADLRVAMRTFGFKPKHMSSIFNLLVAILLLGNLQFANGDAHDVSTHVSNPHVLDQAARLLGVFRVLLNAENSGKQRDQCVRGFCCGNFKSPFGACQGRSPFNSTQIILFDQPGYQTRGPAGTSSMSLSRTQPLISAYGQNRFDEFCINSADMVLQSYVLRHTFKNSIGYNERMVQYAVSLPSISTMGNGACIELLRGAQLSEPLQKKSGGGLLDVINKAC